MRFRARGRDIAVEVVSHLCLVSSTGFGSVTARTAFIVPAPNPALKRRGALTSPSYVCLRVLGLKLL